jgi:hypothetical protein
MPQDFQALAKSNKDDPVSNNVPSATTTEPNSSAQVDDFRVPKRRKRISSGEQEAKKKANSHISVEDKAVFRAETRNYFAPLSSRPPWIVRRWKKVMNRTSSRPQLLLEGHLPIVLTTPTNLLQLQKDVKGLV